jgi:hypothetical protein
MSRDIDTSGQFIAFYIKKGKNLEELSENHFKNKEYKKSLELLSQACAMFEKAKAIEDVERTKKRFNEIKEKFFKKKE